MGARNRQNKAYGYTVEDNRTAEVTIIDDDEPGVIAFQAPKEGSPAKALPPVTASEKSGHAKIRVGRFNGANGEVHVDWKAGPGDGSMPISALVPPSPPAFLKRQKGPPQKGLRLKIFQVRVVGHGWLSRMKTRWFAL